MEKKLYNICSLVKKNWLVSAWFSIVIILMFISFYASVPAEKRTVFSDQSAHISAALSIWYDGDLEYTLSDLKRFREVMPAISGPNGLFLKVGFNEKLYFAKPFIYALFSSPFVGVLGLNGFLLFNMLCIGVMGFIAISILRSHFSDFSVFFLVTGFFVFSPFMAWVPIAHPDIFIATLLTLGVFFLIKQDVAFWLKLMGALAMGLVVYEKPTFIVIFGFILFSQIGLLSIRQLIYISCIALIAWIIPTSVNYLQDGNIFAYQGLRFYVMGKLGTFPLESNWAGLPLFTAEFNGIFNVFGVFKNILLNFSLLPAKYYDFIFGRQTGMVLYFPMAMSLLILIFPRINWRVAMLLMGFFCYLTLNWLCFPTNGYGGGGSYGPRYTMQALPMLFLSFMFAKHIGLNRKTFLNKTTILILGAFLLSVFFQYRVVFNGENSVRFIQDFLNSNMAKKFPMEFSLLPTTKNYLFQNGSYLTEKNSFLFLEETEKLNCGAVKFDGASSKNLIFYQIGKMSDFPKLEIFSTRPVQVDFVVDKHSLAKANVSPVHPIKIKINNIFKQSYFELQGRQEIRWRKVEIKSQPITSEKEQEIPLLIWMNFSEENGKKYVMDSDLTPEKFKDYGVTPLLCWQPDHNGENYWSSGSLAGFDIPIEKNSGDDIAFKAEIVPFISRVIKKQIIDLYVNGEKIKQFEFNSQKVHAIEVTIPGDIVSDQGNMQILFNIHYPENPENVEDDRNLGLSFKKLILSKKDSNEN